MVRLLLQESRNYERPIPLCYLNDLTLGSSAIFQNQNPMEAQEKSRTRSQKNLTRPLAFRLHLSMGLALSQIGNDFVRLPQAAASGRQRSRYLRQAHFITSSKKGASEPNWIGKVVNDTERKLPQSQEDSLGIPER